MLVVFGRGMYVLLWNSVKLCLDYLTIDLAVST